jgi:uncharacterized protein (DUF3820 family)
MENEIWKPIPNYEDYQVSNFGRVKSLKNGKERMLACGTNNGYKRTILNGKHYYVHQLVAMAFLDHVPNKMALVVDHVNGDITNNNVNNLQVITQKENVNKKKLKDDELLKIWSASNNEFLRMPFGKYKNRFVKDIVKNDYDYLKSFYEKCNLLYGYNFVKPLLYFINL